jgi:oxidase EvaA
VRDTASLNAWLADRRRRVAPRVTPITWADCTHWRFTDGQLAHDTGAYFSIVGFAAESSDPALDGMALPMIDQPEIGILAFLLREGEGGYDWLLQAKAEPGTVEGVQAAPSVQATESNYKRVHGGAPTTFLGLVREEGAGANRLADVRQSEQGSMFLNKYNRNVAALIDGALDAGEQWHWTSSAGLRELLHIDYAVNTDARSVIVTTPWSYISETGAPFAARSDAWSAALADSYAEKDEGNVLARLEDARRAIVMETSRVALDALPQCVITGDAIISNARSPALRVQPYAVIAPDREVTQWRQPLVLRDEDQTADLICAKRGGVLRFYFAFSPELGFANIVQLGPSLQSDAFVPGAAWLTGADKITHCSALQSDEGGRFMRCIARYSVHEISEGAARDDENGVWLTLGAIERLNQVQGVFTNEARSLISLLLAWA